MNNKGADQNARMRRLVCAFVVRKHRRQGFSRRAPFTFLPIMHQYKFDQNPSICSEDIVRVKKLHLHYSGTLRMMSGNSANSRIRLQSVMFEIKSGRKSLIVSSSLWTCLNNDIRM